MEEKEKGGEVREWEEGELKKEVCGDVGSLELKGREDCNFGGKGEGSMEGVEE